MLAYKVLGVKMNKQLEQLTKDRVSMTNMPYEFKIVGVSGYGRDMAMSAFTTFDKLKKWAEGMGAEVKLVKNKYGEIYHALSVNDRIRNKTASKGQSEGYLIVEITDPCARILEYIIK